MTQAEEAVTALEAVGLTEYEARCFVALARIPSGTAREVSQVAEIPRSRVYDTVERLERRGLVSVQQTEPREYRAVPIETALRRFRDDFESRVEAAEATLEGIEESSSSETEGMWAITQADHVTDRIVAFLEDAEESVHLLVAEETVVDDRIREELRDATDRGADVLLEVPTESVADDLEAAVPDATVVVAPTLRTTNHVYTERPAQLVMVDQTAIVAAGARETDLPDVFEETAVWTAGKDHGFAAWTRELLDDRVAARERRADDD